MDNDLYNVTLTGVIISKKLKFLMKAKVNSNETLLGAIHGRIASIYLINSSVSLTF